MEPLESEQHRKLIQDPWGNVERLHQEQQKLDALDNEEVKHFVSVKDVACGCGCLKPPGGFCAECLTSVCVDCFDQCSRCRQPLCNKHGKEFDGKRICGKCKGDELRKRLIRSVIKVLLFPFIKFNDE